MIGTNWQASQIRATGPSTQSLPPQRRHGPRFFIAAVCCAAIAWSFLSVARTIGAVEKIATAQDARIAAGLPAEAKPPESLSFRLSRMLGASPRDELTFRRAIVLFRIAQLPASGATSVYARAEARAALVKFQQRQPNAQERSIAENLRS